MQKHSNFLYIFILIFIAHPLSAKYQTEIFVPNIQTLRAHRLGWVLSDPILKLGGSDQLLISFDDLKPDETDYAYTLIHCDANWEKSFLGKTEYIKGFTENYMDDYEYSFNTNVEYAHYKVLIPNEQMQITKSGNYVLKVYDSTNPDKVVCTACFYVVDQKVEITPEIDFNTMVDIKKTTQQINFSVNYTGVSISDPHSETFVRVQQNNRADNQVEGITPTFTRPGILIYQENSALVFKGGNEYRHFDAVSTRFYGEGVAQIELFSPYYHFTLNNDEVMSRKPYLFKNDQNGKFFIRRQEADQDALELESDYIFVHFSLPMRDPILTGEIFLNGDFTYNKFNKETKMVYNFGEKRYEATYFLKQGYYYYRYLFKPTNSDKMSNTPIENDYYETENDYTIYFYFKPLGGRYDRLIGYQKFNTIKRL